MNGLGALQEILVLALVHTGSCKTQTIGKGRPETEMQGERPISERENKTKCTLGVDQQVQSVWLLAGKATKLRENVHTVIHTGQGHKQSRGAFLTWEPPSMGTSVALLDCKKKAFTQTTYEQTFKAFRPGSHCSQWLLLKCYKLYKIYAVSL